MTPPLTTTVHDVFDPLRGSRVSLRWQGRIPMAPLQGAQPRGGRDIDGQALWLLPPLYDADAHGPLVQYGWRHSDAQRAFAGGVTQVNVALPWQLLRKTDLDGLLAELALQTFPRLIPLLSVWPNAESAEFPAWLAAHGERLAQSTPRICKLYSNDPHLAQNVDALWRAGWKPMVWNAELPQLEQLVARAGDQPLHLRHATTPAMLALMRRATRATVQTSPHFLLALDEAHKKTLTVLPPLLDNARAAEMAAVFLDGIDMVASDHVGPHYQGAPISPGLQTQQHFLPALLTLAEQHGWPLDAVLSKAREAAAAVFGVSAPQGWLLVDPEHREPVQPWLQQGPERAPFAGLPLRGRVLAAADASRVELL